MTSAKTFLVYVLAVLFGLLLLGSLRGIFNPIPVPEQSNWALRMGYSSGAALTIVIGSVGYCGQSDGFTDTRNFINLKLTSPAVFWTLTFR